MRIQPLVKNRGYVTNKNTARDGGLNEAGSSKIYDILSYAASPFVFHLQLTRVRAWFKCQEIC